MGPVHCSWDPQISFFNKTFIKNGSHNTIRTFKDYFTIVFSNFTFQFSMSSCHGGLKNMVLELTKLEYQKKWQIPNNFWNSVLLLKISKIDGIGPFWPSISWGRKKVGLNHEVSGKSGLELEAHSNTWSEKENFELRFVIWVGPTRKISTRVSAFKEWLGSY